MTKKKRLEASDHGLSPKPEEMQPVEDQEKDLRDIRIVLESYENVNEEVTLYTVCQHLDTILGETDKLSLKDELIVDHTFNLTVDVNSPKDMDILTSRPIKFTVKQIVEPVEEKEDEQMKIDSQLSIESAVSLYEALTGDKVEKVLVNNQQKKSKKKKEKKARSRSKQSDLKRKSSDKSSKSSKRSKSKSSVKTEVKALSGIKNYGYCTLDLLPLLHGKENFKEILPLILNETHFDDRMVTHKRAPKILVSVYIDKPLEFSCKTSILGLTIESIRNLPSVMKPELNYQICTILPLLNNPKQPTVLTGQYETDTFQNRKKRWPERHEDIEWITQYDFNEDIKTISPPEFISGSDMPRIQFNYLKRLLLLQDGHLALYDHIKKYRKLVVEIYASTKDPSNVDVRNTARSTESVKKQKKKGQSDKGSRMSAHKHKSQTSRQEFLHLMAVLDLSSFLYPGVERSRIAAQLTIYHDDNAAEAGLDQSFFVPKPKESEVQAGSTAKDKKSSKKRPSSKSDKSSKSSKKSKKSAKSKKSGKSGKGKGKNEKGDKMNLKDSLPAEPPPKPEPEPIVKVFDESGQPTFIVVEIELSQPLVGKQELENLESSLNQLLHAKSTTPKLNINLVLNENHRKAKIEELIDYVKTSYSKYLRDKNRCQCPNQADFMTYLRRVGTYQILVYSLVNCASSIVQDRIKLTDDVVQSRNKYQQFIENVFIALMEEVNEMVHKMAIRDRPVLKPPKTSLELLLLYAKEATELKDYKLAEKYHLERLIRNDADPWPWLDYAIFLNERFGAVESFLCIQEVLARSKYNRHGLLLNGLMLADKDQKEAAETCLLNLVVQEPRWVEGWTALYLLYEKHENKEGVDMSREKIVKYMDDVRVNSDYILESDDLAWITAKCPDTVFFRLAILLLKFRMYNWAEYTLSHELNHSGHVHYLLAAVCYYKAEYSHALDHINKAKEFRGTDYGVLSLAGHCYLAMDQIQEALEEYHHILDAFERPDYLHLVYLNYSKVMTLLEDTQEAKKTMLVACKHSPTPFTWISCGKLYFEQNDLISAEECFSEAIMLDDTLYESWAYLSMIDAKLGYLNEAHFCYQLAIKNDIDGDLLTKVVEELENNTVEDKSMYNSNIQ